MLLFKKKFLDAIRSGQKTQTIRLWKFRRMRSGQRSYIPGVGHIRLSAVEPVDLTQLTDFDAQPDGFGTAEELRAELARLYPRQLAEGFQAYRIVFAIERDDPVNPETEPPAMHTTTGGAQSPLAENRSGHIR